MADTGNPRVAIVTGAARAVEPRTALVLSRGLMGSNSALVLRHGAT